MVDNFIQFLHHHPASPFSLYLQTYKLKASVAAGKDDNWIDGWVASFVQEMGLEQAKNLLADYTTEAVRGESSVVGGKNGNVFETKNEGFRKESKEDS